MSQWRLSYPVAFPSIQDVQPIDDVKDHQWGVNCECHPSKEEIFVPGRGVAAVTISHNAYDGRE